jgi:thiopeptide-type bacteriocin biosynthesis protein
MKRASMSGEDDAQWLSGHLFLRRRIPREQVDGIVATIIGPLSTHCLLNGWANRHFFIRYPERGPHLRIRFRTPSSLLESTLRPRIVDFISEHLDREYAGEPDPQYSVAEGAPSDFAALWWVPYVPELARYGGSSGVAVAEKLFHASSALVCDLFADGAPASTEQRFGLAVAAMVVTLAASGLDRSTAAGIARRHRDYWMRAAARKAVGVAQDLETFDATFRSTSSHAEMISAIWNAAESDDGALPEAYATFAQRLRPVLAELQELLRSGAIDGPHGAFRTWSEVGVALFPSYLHMTNNRMGVLPGEEGLLAHMISETL